MTARILIVDDVPANTRLLEAKLAAEYYQVASAKEGFEALRMAHKWQPDLILLDLNLPKMDGREFLARVKKDPRLSTIPIIVLTTSQAEVDIVKSYELQANCYLTKPWELSEFGLLVKSLNEFWIQRATLPRHPYDIPLPAELVC